MMDVEELEIPGVKLISINPIVDDRGFFSRNYDVDIAIERGFHQNWRQENVSLSKVKGTLRGLHFQTSKFAETKLVRVLQGSVCDVFFDIRKNSPTYGRWGSCILSADKPKWIYLPKGIAHGMITLEDNMLMQYKVDSVYTPEADYQIKWDDPTINIKWPIAPTIVSKKDQSAMSFKDFESEIGAIEV